VSDPTASTEGGHLLPEDLYRRALAVGRRAIGVSGPNPPVGCLVVRDGEVLAEGVTQQVGGDHAEVVALAAAGEGASGSTAVVTLEPCAHHGRTPPCVDALVRAGVREVHVLLRDPDPAASGGIAALAAAGITVVDVGARRPDLAAEASHDLRGFLARVRSGRPHVTLKLAQDVDGGTVAPTGGYLTGEGARRHVHRLRAESDVVLVGGATVRADDPQLDVRLVESARQPRPVVITTTGNVPARARVARAGAIVIVGPDADEARCEELRASGVVIERVEAATDAAGVDLATALHRLLDHRVLTVLAEPGVRLASELLAHGLVDVIELHVARGATTESVRPCLPRLAALIHEAVRHVTDDGDLVFRAAVQAAARDEDRAENPATAVVTLEEVA
jgi:diaminohydroxyphosphoribosylaminopyrimidine deaminase/5-amino-6-(5-phosphoribosylamino)uracil reductase